LLLVDRCSKALQFLRRKKKQYDQNKLKKKLFEMDYIVVKSPLRVPRRKRARWKMLAKQNYRAFRMLANGTQKYINATE